MKTSALFAPGILCALVVWSGFGLDPALAQSSPCDAPLSDIHYTKYTVVEGAVYVETNAAGPVLITSNAFFFIAEVSLKTNYTAASAQLIIPNGFPQPMRQDGSRDFAVETLGTNFAEISTAYPGGNYMFIVSNDVTTVTFPDNATLPNTPSLSNYAADQTINPAQDFTLRWNPFTGGRTSDLIQVVVTSDEGEVLESPAYGCPGRLDGTVSSIVISANTLQPDQTYRADMTFVRVLMVDTNSTPFVALLAGTEVQTTATIATGPVISGPVAQNILVLAGGSIRFDVSVTPGTNYLIQDNATLTNAAGWTTLLTTNASGSNVSFTNNPSGKTRFYRVFAH